MEQATFAGGCFWCTEAAFANLSGVLKAVSGYTGGTEETATYEQVCGGGTTHLEAVQVTFNPACMTYETLLDAFWQSIDPTDGGGQFADRGPQYRTAVFYHSQAQQKLAQASRAAVQARLGQTVATEILPVQPFYPAEDYHQKYFEAQRLRYQMYKHGSGRPARLQHLWGLKAEEQ